MLVVIVIVYTFNNSYTISGKFVHVTVTIVQRPYTLITLLITSEEHYYIQSILNSIFEKHVFCNFVGYLFIQYLHTKTFIHGAFYHILKVVDAC